MSIDHSKQSRKVKDIRIFALSAYICIKSKLFIFNKLSLWQKNLIFIKFSIHKGKLKKNILGKNLKFLL